MVNPPGAYQCLAVSLSGDPVAGGWNYYSIHLTDFLNDYPKFGIWPDGIYMSANLFPFPANSQFAGPRMWAFNKAQMYGGASTVQVVSSGGSLRASFKGFANTTSTQPATCGGSWTSSAGGTSGPPAVIPEYITLIVSSSVSRMDQPSQVTV